MSDFAMLKGKARNGQINVGVPAEIEDLYAQIKREHGVDMPEEVRKAVVQTVMRVSEAVKGKRERAS
jgi:hypothetical protein